MDTAESERAVFITGGGSGIGCANGQLPVEDWDSTVAICLTGAFLCLKHEVKQMLDNGGGAIVNIGSTAGLRAPPATTTAGLPAYTAAKHGLIGLTKAAAVEYAAADIRINAVCPGVTDTPMLRASYDLEEQETARKLAATSPMFRLGQPEEIARAAVWLCSDEASFTTGAIVPVDGGAAA